MKNFKSPIDGLNIDQLESNSQAGQDLFVVAMMQGKKMVIFWNLEPVTQKTETIPIY